MPLEKAKLIAVDGGDDIEFMYNPTELKFSRSIDIDQAPGARTEAGETKTSFKFPKPYRLNISNIILDTYEDGNSVLIPLENFQKAVTFATEGEGQGVRPPVYLFTWGSFQYLRCFVKNIEFRFTLFMPDGTPVRAIIDMVLEQVDAPIPRPGQGTPQPSASDRQSSGRR